MNCPVCNDKMKKTNSPYFFGEIKLGEFEAEKCNKCNEVFFTEESSEKIDAKAKELGLWGLEKKTTIGYSGNSLIVRVPKKIGEFLKITQGTQVLIHPEGKNKLIIETIKSLKQKFCH